MAILRAYALPHPILSIPAVGRGEERKLGKTLAAFDSVAKEIAFLRPDTIVFITPHNVVYEDYFHISPGNGAKGNCEDFGTKHVRLALNYDPNFSACVAHVSGKYGISAKTLGEKNAPLDHGVMVPLWFINRRFSKFKAMRVSPSKLDTKAHYRLGQCIAEAAVNIGRRTVVIASGNLSRNLKEKAQTGYLNEALDYDNEILDIFTTGDFNRLLNIPHNIREQSDECGHMVFSILAGCLDRRHINSNIFSYENHMGAGYAVAGFAPGPHNENRNFLEQSENQQRRLVLKSRSEEDAYCILARRALEYWVLHGLELPIPAGLPNEMITNRAGAFVSIYVNEQLRGASGALGPTTDHIAAEIVKNALGISQGDKKFPAVTMEELPDLVYKVDVIGKPELILDVEELDVTRYGVIVSCSDAWGVMLPNQPNIETGQQQVDAVRKRAGIADDATVRLEKFEVQRHE
ncbi:MAG: AMMECR1 domain-containing protein [Defluviitaleaceae bacterium]|nr:AMMECR1 domain-containing protein [Defluviitaleaceae bacterium]